MELDSFNYILGVMEWKKQEMSWRRKKLPAAAENKLLISFICLVQTWSIRVYLPVDKLQQFPIKLRKYSLL